MSEVSEATFVRGMMKAAAQYDNADGPVTLVDVTSCFWHMLRGLAEHPDVTPEELACAMKTTARLYEHARRCCPANTPAIPDLQRWARTAQQPE